MTPKTQTDIIARLKPAQDSAIPPGNAVALDNLFRLSKITRQKSFHTRACRAVTAFGRAISTTPQFFTHLLLAMPDS